VLDLQDLPAITACYRQLDDGSYADREMDLCVREKQSLISKPLQGLHHTVAHVVSSGSAFTGEYVSK